MPLTLRRSRKPVTIAATTLALLLAGCSGRDADMAEKLARAEAAADRAEEAAKRAEAAVKRMPAQPSDPDTEEDAGGPDNDPGEPTQDAEPTA